MEPTFKVNDEVYFIERNKIQSGKVREVLITNNFNQYTVDYDWDGAEYTTYLFERWVYIDIDTLLSCIKFDYEHKDKNYE